MSHCGKLAQKACHAHVAEWLVRICSMIHWPQVRGAPRASEGNDTKANLYRGMIMAHTTVPLANLTETRLMAGVIRAVDRHKRTRGNVGAQALILVYVISTRQTLDDSLDNSFCRAAKSRCVPGFCQ